MSLEVIITCCIENLNHICNSWSASSEDTLSSDFYRRLRILQSSLITNQFRTDDQLRADQLPLNEINDFLTRILAFNTVIGLRYEEILSFSDELDRYLCVIDNNRTRAATQLTGNVGMENHRLPNTMTTLERPTSLNFIYGESSTLGSADLRSQQREVPLGSSQGSIPLVQAVPLVDAQALPDEFQHFLEREPPLSDYYDERSVLGRGSFGTTFRMKNTADNGLYAVKEIRMSSAEPEGISIETLKREATILKRLDHINIVRYYGCFYSTQLNVFCVVMELIAGGTMTSKIKDPTVSLELIVKWWNQLASALWYMHTEKEIQHRDIKPENILLTCDNNIKIIDLGLACIVASRSSNRTNKVGTATYYSYEKANDIPYDGRDDVWAAGCVMAELITKSRLKDRGGAIYLYTNQVINNRRLKLIADCVAVDARYGDIISRMLEPEQNNRCKSKQLLEWLTGGVSLPNIAKKYNVFQSVASLMTWLLKKHSSHIDNYADILDRRFSFLSSDRCHCAEIVAAESHLRNFLVALDSKELTEAQRSIELCFEESEKSFYVSDSFEDKAIATRLSILCTLYLKGFFSIDCNLNSILPICKDIVDGFLNDPIVRSSLDHCEANTEPNRESCAIFDEIAFIFQFLSEYLGLHHCILHNEKEIDFVAIKKNYKRCADNCGLNCMVIERGQLFAGANNFTIGVWDLNTFDLKHSLRGHSGGITVLGVCIGQLVSGSTDKTIKIWNILTYTIVATLTDHTDIVTALVVVDERLYSGSQDNTIKVWNVTTCSLVRTASGHSDSITALCIYHNRLFSASEDKTVKEWDLHHLVELKSVNLDEKCCVTSLVVCSGVLLAASGNTLFRYTLPLAYDRVTVVEGDDVVNCMHVSGNKLYFGSERGTKVLNAVSFGVVFVTIDEYPVTCITAHGGKLYTGSDRGEILCRYLSIKNKKLSNNSMEIQHPI